jgi:predicted Rossmann fold nucleotide-binding protein DprA/Smf involved in DNA uptake
MHLALTKIISGGQTGVDRAALDWAIRHGVIHGGWCPKGRRAVDGAIPQQYQLQETESEGYRQRNRRNVEYSDGTLIINIGALDGGTMATKKFAQNLAKPCLICQLDDAGNTAMHEQVRDWLISERIKVLNVAGPREEKRPGIGALVAELLDNVLYFGH